MNLIRYIFLLVLAFALQTTWIDFFEVSSLKPDLILLALTYIALREGPLVAICMGFGIGFMQDIYHPADLGLNALRKSLIGFAVGYGRSRRPGSPGAVPAARASSPTISKSRSACSSAPCSATT